MLGVVDGPVNWLSYESPVSLFIVCVLAEVWRATAIVLVILIAGLQLIPKEYGEAAEIFGANAWTRFRKITLPLLKPSIQSALILRTVLAFEVFAVVYALSGRNFPVLVGEAYAWQHVNQNNGVAAAYAILVMVISLIATVTTSNFCAPGRRCSHEQHSVSRPAPCGVLVRHRRSLRVGAGADLPDRAGRVRRPHRRVPLAEKSAAWDATLAAMQTFMAVEGVWSAALNGALVAG